MGFVLVRARAPVVGVEATVAAVAAVTEAGAAGMVEAVAAGAAAAAAVAAAVAIATAGNCNRNPDMIKGGVRMGAALYCPPSENHYGADFRS